MDNFLPWDELNKNRSSRKTDSQKKNKSPGNHIILKIQGVPCPHRLGFVELDLECSITLLGK